jgi:hypothetical protein
MPGFSIYFSEKCATKHDNESVEITQISKESNGLTCNILSR